MNGVVINSLKNSQRNLIIFRHKKILSTLRLMIIKKALYVARCCWCEALRGLVRIITTPFDILQNVYTFCISLAL